MQDQGDQRDARDTLALHSPGREEETPATLRLRAQGALNRRLDVPTCSGARRSYPSNRHTAPRLQPGPPFTPASTPAPTHARSRSRTPPPPRSTHTCAHGHAHLHTAHLHNAHLHNARASRAALSPPPSAPLLNLSNFARLPVLWYGRALGRALGRAPPCASCHANDTAASADSRYDLLQIRCPPDTISEEVGAPPAVPQAVSIDSAALTARRRLTPRARRPLGRAA